MRRSGIEPTTSSARTSPRCLRGGPRRSLYTLTLHLLSLLPAPQTFFVVQHFRKVTPFLGRAREAERQRARGERGKRRVSWARWRRNSRRRRRHVMRLRSLKCGGTLAPTCSYLSTPAGRRSSTSRGSTSTQTQHSCFEQHKGLTFSKCGAAETPHTRPTQAIASALTPKFYSISTLNFSILFLEHQPNNLFLVCWKQPLSRLKGVSTRGTCMSCASTKTTRRG